MKGHLISDVLPGSIADEMEIASGDLLLSVNGQILDDIFDYDYLITEELVTLLIQKPDGEEWELEIEKDSDEDLGIRFEQALLNDYKSCTNKCIFCFIDQMPPGMRDTLYFKDDDSRLSFLQGNYVTLTNMSDKDIERIIKYHLSPINISVHTTNKELRCKMLTNRFAGDSLRHLETLAAHNVTMNTQVVLCPDYNDKEELDNTIKDLLKYFPSVVSLSVVPLGMTKYREKLTPLRKFTHEEIINTLDQMERWQEYCLEKYGTRFIHPGDEWYIMAGRDIPPAENYEGYNQIENGVGMVRSFMDEFDEALDSVEEAKEESNKVFTSVCGKLFHPYLSEMCERLSKKLKVKINVKLIVNNFFGEDITVTGLITGGDIIEQLKDYEIGDYLLIPDSMLKADEPIFLDDLTISDLEEALMTKVRVVASGGEPIVRIIDDLR
ncbi:MAG: DUF512 domain-containing protein [Lachnospiraceae bacterium]|nr:DUF512 domain-containing protein [Lachnospiraceae bacterium]